MDSTQQAAAEAEFAHVAAQLTTDELTALAQRVSEGRIEGGVYIDFGCGCFYGSIGIIRGVEIEDAIVGRKFRDQFTEDYESAWSKLTPLEARVSVIETGDTPSTNEASAWLHGLLQAEIARRATP